MVAGGVLAAATAAVLITLTGWAVGRDSAADTAQASAGAAPARTTAVTPDPSVPSAPRVDPEQTTPDSSGRQGPFVGPGGELQLPGGRLPGELGPLVERLAELGIPSLDLVLPDDAIVRSLGFTSQQIDGDAAFGLTIAFEVGGAKAQLTVSNLADLPVGEAVDLAGTPGVIDADGRVVWRSGGDTLTFTLEGRDLDQARLVELAIEIERAMQ
jgi:hypothetical protein